MKTAEGGSSSTLASTSTRVKRTDSIALLRTTDDHFYKWLGGLVHAKALLLCMQIVLFVVGCAGLVATAAPYFPVRISPYDGDFHFQHGKKSMSNRAPLTVNDITKISRQQESVIELSRNILSSVSYFNIFSVMLTLFGLNLLDRVIVHKSSNTKKLIPNPALFLIPGLVAQVLFFVPLFYWTVRAIRMEMSISFGVDTTTSDISLVIRIVDALRFTILPALILWIMLCYVIYGSCLAFVYVWRRAVEKNDVQIGTIRKRGDNLEWSLRDLHPNPSFLRRMNHVDSLNRSLLSQRSRSAKSLRPRNRVFNAFDDDSSANTSLVDEKSLRLRVEDETTPLRAPNSLARLFYPSSSSIAVRVLPTLEESHEEHDIPKTPRSHLKNGSIRRGEHKLDPRTLRSPVVAVSTVSVELTKMESLKEEDEV